jgi:hypothetical protein
LADASIGPIFGVFDAPNQFWPTLIQGASALCFQIVSSIGHHHLASDGEILVIDACEDEAIRNSPPYARLKTAADLVRRYSAYYPRIIRGYSAPYQTSSARAAFADTLSEVLLRYPG